MRDSTVLDRFAGRDDSALFEMHIQA